MRVMVVSPYLPHRQVGHGGGVSVRDLVRYLARRHELILASLVRSGERELLDEVAALGVTVVPLPFVDRTMAGAARLRLGRDRGQAWLRARRSGYPYYVEKYWSPRLSRTLLAAVGEHKPQAIQIEYFQLALLCRDLRAWRDRHAAGGAAGPRLVLNSHEMGSLPRLRRAAASRQPLARVSLRSEARAWERLQVDASRWADTTLCVTDQDRQLLESLGGRACVTVPLGIDTESVVPVWEREGPPNLLFVGSFGHRPNREAAKFLIDKVWPRIAQYSRLTRLFLAGRGSDTFWEGMGRRDERIVALGYVEDLATLYRQCRLFVAPLTEGGGIKIKILEAMARGIPVVTTAIGAEGIVEPNEDALAIAPADAAFAEATIQALDRPDQAQRRAERARRIIDARFSWSAITERLTSLYEGR